LSYTFEYHNLNTFTYTTMLNQILPFFIAVTWTS